jgi:hypothetical protein
MNSCKLPNILLLALVLLISAHLLVLRFYPTGRFARFDSDSDVSVLDTGTGEIYALSKDPVLVGDLIRGAVKSWKWSSKKDIQSSTTVAK